MAADDDLPREQTGPSHAPDPEVKFSPEEEATLLAESDSLRAEANTLFNTADYPAALSLYKQSLASCPCYLLFPRAVLQSNIAACCLKLEDYPEAATFATDALDGLGKLDPTTSPSEPQSEPTASRKIEEVDVEEVEAEIVSAGARKSAPAPASTDIGRIRIKALLRRARARSLLGGWSNLASAEQDYQSLASMPTGSLTPADERTVRAQMKELPGRVKAAQDVEVAEMWGKLKGLGNSMLRPFGLSTENFKMVKDEATGGYSMNFTQGGT